MQVKSIGKVIEIEGDAFKLLIDKDYQEELKGVETMDKIMVVYWISTPHDKPFYEKKGIFATYYTGRPNPLGIEIAEIVALEDNLLIVNGLKARINADIIDLRPV